MHILRCTNPSCAYSAVTSSTSSGNLAFVTYAASPGAEMKLPSNWPKPLPKAAPAVSSVFEGGSAVPEAASTGAKLWPKPSPNALDAKGASVLPQEAVEAAASEPPSAVVALKPGAELKG